MNLLRSFSVVALAGVGLLPLAGCAEDKSFRCQAWCAADASDVVEQTYSAADELDAQEQCFAQYNCSDMPGRILKCICEAE